MKRPWKSGSGASVAFVTALLLVMVALTAAACGGSSTTAESAAPTPSEGEIVSVYQSLGGMVQTGIEVRLDDGKTVDAWLPNDQAVWDRAEAGVRVELEPGDSEDTWEFVRFLEE